ncbi:MAG: hypothetical protein WCK67_04320 [bacterium]
MKKSLMILSFVAILAGSSVGVFAQTTTSSPCQTPCPKIESPCPNPCAKAETPKVETPCEKAVSPCAKPKTKNTKQPLMKKMMHPFKKSY